MINQNTLSESINIIKSTEPKQDGIEFLMSIAGMFDSGSTDTSSNAKDIVADCILQKHHKHCDYFQILPG